MAIDEEPDGVNLDYTDGDAAKYASALETAKSRQEDQQ